MGDVAAQVLTHGLEVALIEGSDLLLVVFNCRWLLRSSVSAIQRMAWSIRSRVDPRRGLRRGGVEVVDASDESESLGLDASESELGSELELGEELGKGLWCRRGRLLVFFFGFRFRVIGTDKSDELSSGSLGSSKSIFRLDGRGGVLAG